MEPNENLRNKAISSVLLKTIEKFISTFVQLIISIILARLLSPNDYGVIAIVNVFIVISNVFLESGLAVGLVQRKKIEDIDISTIFIASVVMGIFLYFIIFSFAPFVSDFYEMNILTDVLRIYGITIIISSVSSVYNSIISRRLKYRIPLIATLVSSIISGVLGILLAYNGFGVWALVYQYLIQRGIYLILIVIFSKYIPKIKFSLKSFKNIISFSWKIFLARFIATIFGQIRNLIIGKQYNDEILGYYNKGCQYPNIISTSIDYSIQSVMFSVYSKLQDDLFELKNAVRRTMKLSAYILFPILIGFACVAEPFVHILLTDKWLPAVPFIQIACITCMFDPVNSANAQSINALGKSNYTLILEIIKRTAAVILLIIAIVLKNIYFMAITQTIVQLVGWLAYMILNKKVLKYDFKEQLIDILPILFLSAFMGVLVYLFNFININYYIKITIQIIAGVLIYFVGSVILKIDSFKYIISFISKLRNKKISEQKDD